MRLLLVLLVALAATNADAASTPDLADTCQASSSYDLTIAPDALRFDHAAPSPRKIELRNGKLVVDGATAVSNTEERDRLALFEQELRALVPKAKTVARNGVDLAVQALRADTAGLGLAPDTSAELERRLAAHATDLKRRIDASTSTHDWQGDAFDRYADDIATDIAPLLAADLGQQAISAAVSGDLDAAATLRDRAVSLGGDLQPRLERRMQALRPQIQALCPAIRRLQELQHGVRDARGRPLDLLEIGKS